MTLFRTNDLKIRVVMIIVRIVVFNLNKRQVHELCMCIYDDL